MRRGGEAARRPPLQASLDALVRPLEFAVADDGARLARLRDLEGGVRSACAGLLSHALPRDLRRHIERLDAEFAKPVESDAQRLERARAALESLAPCLQAGWSEALLERPLTVLPGVGAKRAESLARRGLKRVTDLLLHLPARYEDRRRLDRVGELEVGRRATFAAQVKLVDFVPARGRAGRPLRVLQAIVGDESGTVVLKWFRSADVVARSLHKGDWLLVTGDVKRYRFSKEIVHPDLEPLGIRALSSTPEDEPGPAPVPDVESGGLGRIVPVYTAPEGVNPRALRRLVEKALDEYGELVVGHLPARVVRERGLPEMVDALRSVHRPEPGGDPDAWARRDSPAHQRLVLEELYLLELGLALRRADQDTLPGIAFDVEKERVRGAAAALPFRLTGAQRRVWREILADLARPHPMSRLLQGDVGSGKTAIALLAAVAAAASGVQTALMAPTELLAEQHARTLSQLGAGLGLRIGLLTASRPRTEADAVRGALAEGALDLVVGTQSLLQEEVHFARLGLVVIDEQHRFGVRQRAALAERSAGGLHPHTLVMTATPIPRTLALTLYGDLDLSVIDELPPGREPVRTLLLREGEGRRITALVSETLARGEQVYVVYPLVEESEKIDLRAATLSAERIRAAFPEHAVDLVHGRLDAEARASAMARFVAGETHILVSTTVIEVGVDVPDATLMIVEHAERFGLAQLHQLRGRVGRGARAGTCVLVDRGGGEKSEARLTAMLETTDGFAIADADLAIRGPGEFLGTRQSGHLPELRVADLLRDARLLSSARQAAFDTVRRDPGLQRQPDLRRAVEARWGDKLALSSVG